MKFVANGPDVPLDVLAAEEEGRLVFFCGAGVSIPAGLPTFAGLVERVYQGLNATRSAQEEMEWTRKSYDRVLHLLEGEERFTRAQVRQQVRRILAVPASPSLGTHRAILTLARDPGGRTRLVTTNFDLLFEAADPSVRVTAAPFLPVPKPQKWDRVVYLHGRLDDSDPEGQHLVLTSGDFGVAYLVERWASRFVSELFNHSTILFVGYSVDDPVMRYLVDAIAAERRLDTRINRAFAFAECGSADDTAVVAEWSARGIEPITYASANGHAVLHQTLKAWAGIWSGGLGSKLNIVGSLASRDPSTLPEEEVSKFCWAVADPSGAMASELARLGVGARLEWLDPLERQGLLEGTPDPRTTASVALVDDGRTTIRPPSLDATRRAFAVWLSKHLGNADLARWALKRGASLHPEFASCLRRELRASPALPISLRKVWLALSGSVRLRRRPDAYDRFEFYHRLDREAWSPALRLEVVEALSPCLEVTPSWSLFDEDSTPEGDDAAPLSVGSILSFECELEAGQALALMLEELRARSDWAVLIADMAFDVTALLRRALDMHAALDRASEDNDPSYIQHPSIAPHEQNQDFHGWTKLIELAREALEALCTGDASAARSLVGVWRSTPYPVFRRLVLYAARTTGLMATAEMLETILAQPSSWTWSYQVKAEFLKGLPWLWENLDAGDRQRLQEAILSGPEREMFRKDLESAEFVETRDHAVWERLARLARGGAELGDEAAQRLQTIEASHPAWRLTGEEREDFPTWMSSGFGIEADFSADALFALGDDELARVLMEHEQHREGLLDTWAQVAKRDQPRALRVLSIVLDRDGLDPFLWSRSLSAFREVGEAVEVHRDLVALLERIPAAVRSEERVLHPAAEVLRAIAEKGEEALWPRLFVLWDGLLPAALVVAPMHADDRVTAAINHPVGVLVEALLFILGSKSPERGAGINVDVRERLERIVHAADEPARLGRVIVASRLAWLHDLDPDWTATQVVPLFDWHESEEATGAWQGFLWSPWIRPSLWAHLKEHFLAAFDHVGALGRAHSNLPPLLASIAIGGEGELSAAEAGACLRKLDDTGRESVAIWLQHQLKGAAEKAAELWRSRIGPWIESAWPREPRYRGPGASVRLAWVATYTGEAFPEAAAVVAELVGPANHTRMILEEIEERGLLTSEPEACLALINALTPDDPEGWFGPLAEFVAAARAAMPKLGEDPRFRRLETIAIRTRLQ